MIMMKTPVSLVAQCKLFIVNAILKSHGSILF